MRDVILKLRKEGKTYDEIKEILKCSKSTISYHCGDGQKNKNYQRTIRRRDINRKSTLYIIRYKLRQFAKPKIKQKDRKALILAGKKPLSRKYVKFDYDAACEKIIKSKVCYLSGRNINISDPNSFHLDHITPIRLGGKDSVDNMGVTCKDANMAKSGLTVQDFINLCIDVCTHNGYKVKKISK